MKNFTCKWLKRFSALIAIKLFILATILTLLRILFVSIADYKEDLTGWLASEYRVNLSVEDISAGIDFSGLVLTLNNVELVDSAELPFDLKLDYIFLHLDFWNSVTEHNLNFKRISLQGVDLTVKNVQGKARQSEQSLLTIESLQSIFLEQLDKFSVKDGQVHFTDNFANKKTIIIEQLRWLNKGDAHQGIGSASLPNSLGDNSLEFVIDLSANPENADDPLQGELYVQADNINISDYLIDRVNPNAQITDAVLGFEVWAEFTADKLQQVQVVLNDSKVAWTQSKKNFNWQLNSGLLQLSNSDQGWLLDSYDLDIEQNNKKLDGLKLSGHGTYKQAFLNFTALSLKDVLPFYLLESDLSAAQLSSLSGLALDAQIPHLAIARNNDNTLQFNAQLSAFKNRPQGAIPGISNANIKVQGQLAQGEINISLPKQKIYFDGQFSRTMPVESASLALRWLDTPSGFKLFSEQSLLKTTDLDTITEFSLLFPNKQAKNQSPLLSLYSYASLNDGSKAQYYFPIKAMGDDVFNYLQPTIKKGTVTGAKILWYGAFNNYPYQQHNGIFQAWVPLRDAQYDFYGKWQGLTDLDLDLLFENDHLTMNARQASLGAIKVQKLSAKIDLLNPDGILSINAEVAEDAQKISDYLKVSPLKDSVGRALTAIEVQKNLSGKLQLTIPFDRSKQQTQTIGKVALSNNNINIKLADDSVLPLQEVQGQFSFINGNLTAKNLSAKLFTQDLQVSFDTIENKETYQVVADLAGVWDLQKLTNAQSQLAPLKLSGFLDWTGKVNFEHYFSGGYKSTLVLNSTTQGVKSKLPAPFNKNALQSWPTDIVISDDNQISTVKINIKDKLDFIAALNYQDKQQTIPYFTLNIGSDKISDIDTEKHLIKINLDRLNLSDWYLQWKKLNTQEQSPVKNDHAALLDVDQILVDIKHATFFEQPLTVLQVNAVNDKKKWSATVSSDNLNADLEYRFGVPARVDLDIKKINFKSMNSAAFSATKGALNNEKTQQSYNLLEDYPEVFAQCTSCIYGDYDFSPLQMHLYPSKSRLNIDYINIGTENEFTHISGVWDQRRTNMIIDSIANEDNSLAKRLGFTSPVVYKKAEVSGAFNWIGAPWEFNYESLNGAFSSMLKDGSITEVSDNGARLLSLFSLDGIRRSLNLEFGNVFAKGLNFDDFTFSGNITDGVIKNDDFYLSGSAGKITGNGLIDLANYETNYKVSYSPAVTSSLPVLTAFAISPITGAAVLLMSKILEPVVDTIIRVDFSIKGALNDPEVKLISRKKGQVKLQNSEVLEKINEQQLNNHYGAPDGL